jgi:hypothetical protein
MRFPDRLPDLDVATPELLARRELLRRTDDKFALPADALASLLAALAPDYAVVESPGGRWAAYRTLYFDTAALDLHCAHEQGRRPSHKVRIRHYSDRGLSFFEVKTRLAGGMTQKLRRPKRFGDSELDAADRSLARAHLPAACGELAPVVWTDFQRLTLVGVRTAERVTIDLGIRFARDGRAESGGPDAVVEVKRAPFCGPTPVGRALDGAGARPVSASKYAAGVARMGLGGDGRGTLVA